MLVDKCRWLTEEEFIGILSLSRLLPGPNIVNVSIMGGANAIIPEIDLRAVEIEHWMTDADFSEMFALSQAAPGPNVLIVSLIGWKAAGVAGAVVAMVSMCAPSSVLTYYVAHVWDRF